MEKKAPTIDEMESIVLDMPALDYLMAKWFTIYRIADTLTWMRFPPHKELSADLQDETMIIINLEYIWDDPICKWQIAEAMKNEDMFHKTISLLMGNIGSKSYIKTTVYGPYAATDISNSMFAQKRLEECKKWQELGLKMAQDDQTEDRDM
jgi:hypothetical protein